MASTENEYYLRAILLLTEGGSYISKKVLHREVDKNGGDLDILLRTFERKLRHQLHKKQCEKLFLLHGKTDVQRWDFQMVISVLKILFRKTLSQAEKDKFNVLLVIRNDTAHSSSASLDQEDYNELRNNLQDAIVILASGFAQDVKDTCLEYISKYGSGPLDITSAIENMRMLQDNDAMFRQVLARIEGLKLSTHTEIQNIDVKLSELEKRLMTRLNGLNPYAFEKKIQVGVHTELKVCGPSEDWSSLMESTLNDIFNEAKKTAGDDFGKLKQTVGQLLEIIRVKAHFKGSELKCVVLMFECTTYADLQWLLMYFKSSAYQQELEKIATSLTTYFNVDKQVGISSAVTQDCLQDIFRELDKEYDEEAKLPEENKCPMQKKTNTSHSVDEAEKSKGLQLALECTSLEELRHVWNLFQKGGATEHLNEIADALSDHFGVNVSLKAQLDIGEFKAAIEETVGHQVFEIQEDKHNLGAIRGRQIFDEYKKDKGSGDANREYLCTGSSRQTRIGSSLERDSKSTNGNRGQTSQPKDVQNSQNSTTAHVHRIEEHFIDADDSITELFGSLIDPEGSVKSDTVSSRADTSKFRLKGLKKCKPRSFDTNSPGEENNASHRFVTDLSPTVEIDELDYADAPTRGAVAHFPEDDDLAYSDISQQEQQRRLDNVGRRLAAIGEIIVSRRESESDGYIICSSEELDDIRVGSQRRRLSQLEQELLTELRRFGEESDSTLFARCKGINISILPIIKGFISAQDYSTFSNVVQREISNTIGWEQVAWYTYLMKATMDIAGANKTVGLILKNHATKFFSSTIKPWIQSRPKGWESIQ